jgi:hypothetical protein
LKGESVEEKKGGFWSILSRLKRLVYSERATKLWDAGREAGTVEASARLKKRAGRHACNEAKEYLREGTA